jgi:hypothetical protein
MRILRVLPAVNPQKCEHILRNHINRGLILFVTILGMWATHVYAQPTAEPASIATLDSDLRAEGNRKDIAERAGDKLFATEWPAQVLKVAADSVDDHVVIGLRISGVHFHTLLTREQFINEILALVQQTFALTLSPAPAKIEEIDVWTVVPFTVGKGVVVNGDLAKPTTRTVFTLSVRRGESPASILQRMRNGANVYWDDEWIRTKLGGVRARALQQ